MGLLSGKELPTGLPRSKEDEEDGERRKAGHRPVRIVVDGGSDLPPDLLERYGIVRVPLIVRFGERTFSDEDLSLDEFWHHAERWPPQTSQPSIGAFEAAFAPPVEKGAMVLCITITSRHSGTYNSAWAAAQRFPGQVRVWDSQSLSLGVGLQVVEAAVLAQEGRPLEEILDRLEAFRRHSRLTILLDTLEYLRRGGRLDGAIRVADGLVRVLGIRVLLRMKGGALGILGAVRTYGQGLARLREDALAEQPLYRLAIAHTRRPAVAARLAEEIAGAASLPAEAVLVGEAGPALSAHAGPGTVGVVAVGQLPTPP